MSSIADYDYTLPAHDRTCTDCGKDTSDVLRFWQSNAAGAAAVVDPEAVLCLDCLSKRTDGESHPLARLKEHESIEDFDYDPERNVITIHTEGRAFGRFDHVFHIGTETVTVDQPRGRRSAAAVKMMPTIISSEMVDGDGDVPDVAFGISPYRKEAEQILADLTRTPNSR